jgi:hypothetical protein
MSSLPPPAYAVGDQVTWLGQPRGKYAIRATVIAVGKLFRIRIARPSRAIPEEKSVHPMSLRPGAPRVEIRWDAESVIWEDVR